jgi:SAM-dependent methyltransferase
MTGDDRSARERAADQWQRNPAGTTDVPGVRGTAEFYREITRQRYELQPWHPALLRSFAPSGRMLEIGCGAGTDHAVLAETATSTVGVDLAHHGASLTNGRLRLEGRSGGAIVADGESLPFPDGSFDEIYSFGVIHHTDHPERVVREMRRVLRPGGRFLVAVYHRWSLFTAYTGLGWFLSGRQVPWTTYLGSIEKGWDEADGPPVVKLYSARQARRLFEPIGPVSTQILHFGLEDPRVVKVTNDAVRRRLASLFGWYVVVRGQRVAD